MSRQRQSRNRDAVYYVAPTRAGGWRVVKVLEHGPYHDKRPATWRGPYATSHDASLAAYDAEHTTPPAVDFAAFRWCAVCGSQHHPDCSTCDGLRGGTTDQLSPAVGSDGDGLEGELGPETDHDRQTRQQVEADTRHSDMPRDDRPAIVRALQVLILDPATRAYLRAHDPKALQQAARALHDIGERYQLFGEAPTATGDLCWYCLLPLTRQADGTEGCPDCRHDGRAVQPQPDGGGR
jgi:hypothetical protein